MAGSVNSYAAKSSDRGGQRTACTQCGKSTDRFG